MMYFYVGFLFNVIHLKSWKPLQTVMIESCKRCIEISIYLDTVDITFR